MSQRPPKRPDTRRVREVLDACLTAALVAGDAERIREIHDDLLKQLDKEFRRGYTAGWEECVAKGPEERRQLLAENTAVKAAWNAAMKEQNARWEAERLQAADALLHAWPPCSDATH